MVYYAMCNEWVAYSSTCSYINCPHIHAPHVGKEWIKQMFFGASLFPALICGLAFLINFIAIYYHASRAIPFFTMVSTTPRLTSSIMDIRIHDVAPFKVVP